MAAYEDAVATAVAIREGRYRPRVTLARHGETRTSITVEHLILPR